MDDWISIWPILNWSFWSQRRSQPSRCVSNPSHTPPPLDGGPVLIEYPSTQACNLTCKCTGSCVCKRTQWLYLKKGAIWLVLSICAYTCEFCAWSTGVQRGNKRDKTDDLHSDNASIRLKKCKLTISVSCTRMFKRWIFKRVLIYRIMPFDLLLMSAPLIVKLKE